MARSVRTFFAQRALHAGAGSSNRVRSRAGRLGTWLPLVALAGCAAVGKDSPHAFNQLPLFSAKQWVRLPYHRDEVNAQRIGTPLVLTY